MICGHRWREYRWPSVWRASSRSRRDAATTGTHETGRLNQLIGEVLILARLESGVPLPQEDYLDLHSLLETLVEDARFEEPGARSGSKPRRSKSCCCHAEVNCCIAPLTTCCVMRCNIRR